MGHNFTADPYCGTEILAHTNNTIIINIIIVLALDAVVSLVTIIGNCIFLVVLCRSTSLHVPSNMFLGALCLSDLLVGFACQPLFIAYLLLVTVETNHCKLLFAYRFASIICCGLSFAFPLLISIDRYIAISFPFRYLRIASCRKMIKISILMAISWVAFSIIALFNKVIFVWGFVGYGWFVVATILFTYVNIYIIVCKQQRVTVTLGRIEGADNTEDENTKHERRKTCTVGIIVALFLVCYIPILQSSLRQLISGPSTTPGALTDIGFIERLWIDFSMLSNSCINPLVYYLRSKDIRRNALREFGAQTPAAYFCRRTNSVKIAPSTGASNSEPQNTTIDGK